MQGCEAHKTEAALNLRAHCEGAGNHSVGLASDGVGDDVDPLVQDAELLEPRNKPALRATHVSIGTRRVGGEGRW